MRRKLPWPSGDHDQDVLVFVSADPENPRRLRMWDRLWAGEAEPPAAERLSSRLGGGSVRHSEKPPNQSGARFANRGSFV